MRVKRTVGPFEDHRQFVILVAGSDHDPPGTRPRFTRQDGKSHRVDSHDDSRLRGPEPRQSCPWRFELTGPGRAQAVNAIKERLRRRAGRWGSREVQRNHQTRDAGHTNIAAGLRTTALRPYERPLALGLN